MNWGKRICSPPPYHSAMPPKRYTIGSKFPFWVVLLNFSLLYLHPVFNPFFNLEKLEKKPFFPFWLSLIYPFDWLYSISKHTMPKSFPSLLYWKRKCIFSLKKTKIDDKWEPLTIRWLRIREWLLDLNLKFGLPNDIRKYKLIHT